MALTEQRTAIARTIWNIRREDEDRCDLELEDLGLDHSVWREADAVIAALPASEKKSDLVTYGCHCDIEDHMEPDGCVIDDGRFEDCIYAKRYGAKEECKFWKPIKDFTRSPDRAARIQQQSEVIVGMGERISQLENIVIQAAEVESKSAARIKELETELGKGKHGRELELERYTETCTTRIAELEAEVVQANWIKASNMMLSSENEALKEKLRVARDALLDCQIATDWVAVHRTAKEALASVQEGGAK